MLKLELELDVKKNKEYEVETIKDSAVYVKAVKSQLLKVYYLVSWIDYLKDKSIWEPASAVLHLWKMVSSFHKGRLKKPIVVSLFLDSVFPMAKLMAKPTIK